MPKKNPDPLTKEELDRIMLVVNADKNAKRRHYYSLLFNLLRHTGRRIGEFYGINIQKSVGKKTWKDPTTNKPKYRTIFKKTGRWNYGVQVKDIDWKNKYIYTYILKKRKRVRKPAKLNDELLRQLKDFILSYKLRDEDYIFRNNKIKKSYTEIQMAFKNYAKKSGIKKKNVSLHSIRHYVITHLRKQGWSYEDIAKVTGHTTPSVIGIYDQSTLADIEDKLDDALKDI